jgi:hypothetical protein
MLTEESITLLNYDCDTVLPTKAGASNLPTFPTTAILHSIAEFHLVYDVSCTSDIRNILQGHNVKKDFIKKVVMNLSTYFK